VVREAAVRLAADQDRLELPGIPEDDVALDLEVARQIESVPEPVAEQVRAQRGLHAVELRPLLGRLLQDGEVEVERDVVREAVLDLDAILAARPRVAVRARGR